jgi:2-dehydro-3-deoxygluconokinase
MNERDALAASDPEVLCIGEGLVALIAEQPGRPLSEVTSYSAHVVGAELNTAVGIARLGHRVAYAGRVGEDEFGRSILRRLKAEGIITTWATTAPAPTALLFRDLRMATPSRVIYRRADSAGAQLSPDDIKPALEALPEGAFVHLSGITAALSPSAYEAALMVARYSREERIRFCLDLNFRSTLWSEDQARERLGSLIDAADVVIGTSREGRIISGADDIEQSLGSLCSAGAALAVLRHGLSATARQRGGASVSVDGLPLASPPDPVGAGDAFAAGLLSGLLERLPLESALDRAHRCGAAAAGTVGDIEGALTREELVAETNSDVRR